MNFEPEKKSRNARERSIQILGGSGEIYPENEAPGDWDLWTRHRQRGGILSFAVYCARAKINREKRSSKGHIPRFRQPRGDQGLKMEVSSVLAKFGRMGLLPKAPTRPA